MNCAQVRNLYTTRRRTGLGEGYFLPSLATDFLPHVARAERPWRSGGLYYGYPAATWPQLEVGTGKSLRPTVAPPPSWARGGGTGRLRRPKLGSVPGGLLGDAQGWETSGKTKIQDKEHTVAREWVGEHRPTGRGVKGAGAPSLKGEGRRPGKPDVGPGRAGFRVTSTCREGPVFTKWSPWALTSRQAKIDQNRCQFWYKIGLQPPLVLPRSRSSPYLAVQASILMMSGGGAAHMGDGG